MSSYKYVLLLPLDNLIASQVEQRGGREKGERKRGKQREEKAEAM